jgi:hypothetical protein
VTQVEAVRYIASCPGAIVMNRDLTHHFSRPALATLAALTVLTPASVATPHDQTKAVHVHPSVSQGIFSSLPFGIVDRNAASGSAGALLIGDPGPMDEEPGEWSDARFAQGAILGSPAYTTADIFGSLAPDVRFAAVSTGNDFIPPVLGSGMLDFVTIQRWFALSVSVTNESDGQPQSHIKRLKNSGDTPGSELFTYYFSKSVGLPQHLINTVQSERSREAEGFQEADLPGGDPGFDVGGLDFGLGVIPHDPDGFYGTLFHKRDRLYFTLTRESVAALGATDFARNAVGQMVPAHTGVIYGVEWGIPSGAANYAWSTPFVEYDRAELGLTDVISGLLPGDVVVDAICVDVAHKRLIFSTEHIPGRDELFVSQRFVPGQSPVPPKVLKDGNGIKVSSQLGLDPDSDVDGTCGIDPEQLPGLSKGLGMPLDIGGGGGVLDGPLSGGAGGGGLAVGAPLGMSVNRTGGSASGEFTIEVTGLGKAGVGPDGILQVFVSDVTDLLSSSGPIPHAPASWTLLHEGLTPAGQGQVTVSVPAPAGVASQRSLALQAVHYRFVPDLNSPLGFGISSPRTSWTIGIDL